MTTFAKPSRMIRDAMAFERRQRGIESFSGRQMDEYLSERRSRMDRFGRRTSTHLSMFEASSSGGGGGPLLGKDAVSGASAAIEAVPDQAGAEEFLSTVDAYGSSYRASRLGKLFAATHQTPGTVVTGQTSFVATTPTFLLRQNAGTKKVALESIELTLVGTAPGGDVSITVAIDTADRFSAGGTSVTPQNVNTDSVTASGITSFLYNPTATAAGGGTRYVWNGSAGQAVPTFFTIPADDGWLVGTTGAVLVYTWAATTGPSWYFTFHWKES